MLNHLKGMFAFAIYDAAREELFIARDRLGIKPLYYVMDANGFRAASEVRVLAVGWIGWNHGPIDCRLSAMGRLSRTKSSLLGPPRVAGRPCDDDRASGRDQDLEILAIAQGVCFFAG